MQSNKPVSVKDIATALGISLSTVHKALTGKPGVGEKRRREVLEFAARMGYTVNSAAQSLARKAMRLGVIMPDCWQEYFGPIREGIEGQINALRECRLEGEFCYLPLDYPQNGIGILQKFLQEYKPDAVLYCPSHHSINEIAVKALSSLTVPVFWVGGGDHNPLNGPAVAIDAALSGNMAADFLCCVRGTDTRAAVFTGSLQSSVHRAKSDAFCTRVLQNGGSVLRICETEDDNDRADAAVRALLEAHPDVNAIYVSTLTSLPVCRYLEQSGRVGAITLLGTDDFDALRAYMRRGVVQATIFQNQARVGEEAVQYAYEYLNRSNSYGREGFCQKERILIAPQLLLRANIE